MSRAVRIMAGLVGGLAILTAGAAVIVEKTARSWFEKDLASRGELAVTGARRVLMASWGQPEELAALLGELARDERILGAAACGQGDTLLAATPWYPAELTCAAVGPRVRKTGGWEHVESLRGGDVHVTALPVWGDNPAAGFVVLVHDLSFVQRREASTRRFLVIVFGVMAIGISLVTLLVMRGLRLGWIHDMRRWLRGGEERPELAPLLGDVRDLVARIAAEEAATAGAWNAERLKQTLRRNLRGERVVMVANREPYIHEKDADGTIKVVHPASGLVTALEPVMRACSGVWVAHGNGSADRETADRHGRVRVPPGDEAYVVRRVWLTPEEEAGYYYGFSNEGLWPLCHIAHTRPTFRAEDWQHYQNVNRRFADAVLEEVDGDDPIVMVQDYHFALAPRLIRARLPRATILTFWHIPWPNPERFGICPWREAIIEGLLGSSIFGCHTPFHCQNFLDTVDRYLEARIDRSESMVVHGGRATLVRPYPISVEWPVRWAVEAPPVAECRRTVRAELGVADDALLGVGVDRLDYTKGIEERILAVERLLDRFPEYRGRFVFVQVAAPSRTVIERYRRLNESVDALAARINERYGQGTYRPIILLRTHKEPPAVFRYYRAADVCYVSSLHDGMNLVAKEFVAARDDERGVLVLSHFTGAARELTEALIVNPYDLEQASSALAEGLRMSPAEQRDRMHAMRALLAELNVYRWAGRMLEDAARLRRRERLAGRWTAANARAN